MNYIEIWIVVNGALKVIKGWDIEKSIQNQKTMAPFLEKLFHKFYPLYFSLGELYHKNTGVYKQKEVFFVGLQTMRSALQWK